MALTTTDLKGSLPLLTRGKVRDIYQLNDRSLLFVATDRISAYDVIMKNVSHTDSHPTDLTLIMSIYRVFQIKANSSPPSPTTGSLY